MVIKKIFSIILIVLTTFTISCGSCTVKERVVIKTKIITPTFNCAKPEPYKDFKEKLISTEYVHSEGALYEVISQNVKMMERQILLWENHDNCIEKILNEYNKQKGEENAEENEKN